MRKLILFVLALISSGCIAENANIYYIVRSGQIAAVSCEVEDLRAETLFKTIEKVPFGEDVTSPVPENTTLVYSFSASGYAEAGFETAGGDKGILAECFALTLRDALDAELVGITVNGRFCGSYPGSGKCVIYCPEASGTYIVPVPEDNEGEVSAEALLRMLSAESETYLRAVPGSTGDVTAEYAFTDTGRRVLSLDFPMYIFNALEDADETRWQFLAAVSLTMLSNLSDADCVRVSFGGQPVNGVPDRDGTLLRLEDGCIYRSTFSGYIGSEVCAGRFVGCADAQNVRAILAAVLPELIGSGDVISWSVSDGKAEIDLSRDFYAACGGMNAETERQTVYAMVNAVCRNTDAEKVHFTVEGNETETLAGVICLEGWLLPDEQ